MANKIDFDAWYQDYIEQVRQKVMAAVQKEIDQSVKDWVLKAEDRIQKMFVDTVENFYNDYTPDYYDRRESMYNLLETVTTSDGLIIRFNPEAMSFRNGYAGRDGLYGQVFVKGWHGGAASGEDHPEPGVPYWRDGRDRFRSWGLPAEIARISPLDEMKQRVKEYEKGQAQDDFEKILYAHLNGMQF